ncbi:hypothetical protein CLF_103169, partial [Clonorchis sinensis]
MLFRLKGLAVRIVDLIRRVKLVSHPLKTPTQAIRRETDKKNVIDMDYQPHLEAPTTVRSVGHGIQGVVFDAVGATTMSDNLRSLQNLDIKGARMTGSRGLKIDSEMPEDIIAGRSVDDGMRYSQGPLILQQLTSQIVSCSFSPAIACRLYLFSSVQKNVPAGDRTRSSSDGGDLCGCGRCVSCGFSNANFCVRSFQNKRVPSPHPCELQCCRLPEIRRHIWWKRRDPVQFRDSRMVGLLNITRYYQRTTKTIKVSANITQVTMLRIQPALIPPESFGPGNGCALWPFRMKIRYVAERRVAILNVWNCDICGRGNKFSVGGKGLGNPSVNARKYIASIVHRTTNDAEVCPFLTKASRHAEEHVQDGIIHVECQCHENWSNRIGACCVDRFWYYASLEDTVRPLQYSTTYVVLSKIKVSTFGTIVKETGTQDAETIETAEEKIAMHFALPPVLFIHLVHLV